MASWKSPMMAKHVAVNQNPRTARMLYTTVLNKLPAMSEEMMLRADIAVRRVRITTKLR